MATDRLRQAALVVWVAVGAVILGYVVLLVADSVRVIWLPIAFAAGLVFVLEPAVKSLERLRVPRVLGTILAFLGLSALLLTGIALILPVVRDQAVDFVQQLPAIYAQAISWAKEFGASLGIDVEELLSQEAIEEWLNDPANQETI
ncbi:MAG: AI-2E family transporter, partial [Acidimicrobiia bacterium]